MQQEQQPAAAQAPPVLQNLTPEALSSFTKGFIPEFFDACVAVENVTHKEYDAYYDAFFEFFADYFREQNPKKKDNYLNAAYARLNGEITERYGKDAVESAYAALGIKHPQNAQQYMDVVLKLRGQERTLSNG